MFHQTSNSSILLRSMESYDQESNNPQENKRKYSHTIVQDGLTSTKKWMSGPYPPGYRFMPTDDELILYYLRKKVNNEKIPIDGISDVYLKKNNPKDLTEKYPNLGDNEWYFFTPRDRKYPNGSRPNRAADNGYWKATGADKPVRYQDETVGYRKTLVFYEGKAQRGVKSSWIMHEFRLNKPPRSKTNADNMRLDDWVLCRIYEKAARPSKPSNSNRRQKEGCESVDDEYEIINNVRTEEGALNEENAPELVDTNGNIAGFENHVASDELTRDLGDNWVQSCLQTYTNSPHDESVLINGDLQSSTFDYGLLNSVGQVQQNVFGSSVVLNQPLNFQLSSVGQVQQNVFGSSVVLNQPLNFQHEDFHNSFQQLPLYLGPF